MIRWQWLAFDELDTRRLYAILAARSEVFVLEQNCVYRDLDGLDWQAWHLVGWESDGAVAAYLRVLQPGVKFTEFGIGRVLTAQTHRGSGLGRALMLEALQQITQKFGRVPIRLAAQAYLRDFYASFGFCKLGEEYLEDGIAHIDMSREA